MHRHLLKQAFQNLKVGGIGNAHIQKQECQSFESKWITGTKKVTFRRQPFHTGAKGHRNKPNSSFSPACASFSVIYGVYTTESASRHLIPPDLFLSNIRLDKFHNILAPTVQGEGDKTGFPSLLPLPVSCERRGWGMGG